MFNSEVLEPDQKVLSCVQSQASPKMNSSLISFYSADEVQNALFDIGDLKIP